MKKLFSTIIVFLMAFALMVPAGASNKVDPKDNPEINPDTKSGSITIAKKGSEFSVYKILNAEAKKGQNVFNYTANSNFEGFFGNSDYDNLTIKDIAAMPNELNKRDDNGNITDPITSATTKLTNPLQKYISDMGIEPVTTISCPNDGSSVTVNLEIGFYLIVETGTHSDSASVASKSMLVPLPMVETTNGTNAWNYNLNITPKDEPVNITKKIVEDDNRVDESTNFIGREINYEIKADIPHYDASTDIDSVKYVMTDTLSKGLDFVKGDVEVVVSGGGLEDKTLDEGTDYTINYSEDNKTMTITYTYINIMDYTDVTVTYAAKLNENALIGGGDLANPNKIELEYTNNPSTWDTSKPSDEVKSFTYGVQINKVDENDNTVKLEGAEFVLLDENHQPIAAYTYKDGKVVVLQNEEVVRTDANGLAYFVGLDAGTYYLRETKAPDGYVLLDGDVKLEIRVINETTGEAEYYLEDKLLTTTASIENGGEIASVPTNSQVAVGTIGNSEGFNLPMTGGAGTWMFTVGGILIMASMITVFVKLRKKEN
ncbi:SpaH/EbpB family LPXTG-anchored major pilin [Thomasclavelia saccharogumia]|uniref:SpaH/EbpB family LPXTG-anchored major pilin n=1 Tax=Thomasclavelia saccharogumia TaxID=341225 RepID=UPI00047B9F84|nr:SpaH/EbpB family LPXTG-anchored major pilin [Thomasclavelia saccharogumia]